MFKIIIILILSFTYLHCEWIEEGDYLKLNHDMTNISEMRYSIDTTHIILINNEKINYYNKHTGEFSKSFSAPHYLAELIDTKGHFSDPVLSIDEKIISYTNTFTEPYNFCLNIEEAYYDIESKNVTYAGCENFNNFVHIKWGNFDSYLIPESINNKLKYNYHYIDIGFSSLKIERTLKNTLKSPSSIRIENINSKIKYNPLNNAIAQVGNRLIIVHSGDVFGKDFSSDYNEYNHYYDSLKKVEQIIAFANDQEHIFIIEKNKNILNKYNYVDDKNNFIPSNFNYSKVYYLSDNKFLGVSGNEQNVLDGDDLSLLYKYETQFKSDLSFYDSTNYTFYYKDSSNIYKQFKNINTLDTLVASFTSPEFAIVNNEVQFINTSIGTYDEVLWEIENSKISTNKHVSFTFKQAGTYRIKLTLTKGLLEKTYETKIEIHDNIIADFDIEILTKDKPIKVKIINKVKNFKSVKWLLNNDNIGLLKDSTINIKEYGKYNLKQIISDDYSIDTLIKDFELFPTIFDTNLINFNTITNNRVNIDYFNAQDIFHASYINNKATYLYSITQNYNKYNLLEYKTKFTKVVDEERSSSLLENGYIFKPFQIIPILYYNSNALKYFENDFELNYKYYNDNFNNKYRESIDSNKNVISLNTINNIKFIEIDSTIINKIKVDTINSSFNIYKTFKDDYPETLTLNNKKYFVQNHQLYYFDFINEEVVHYEDVFKDLSRYYITKVNSEVNLFYKDLSNNWFNVKLDDNNKLVKSNFQFNNKIAIKDIFGLDYHLYLLSANNKIYEYDLTTKTETELKNIELDSIQVMEELGGNLVLFGKKDGNLAYQILNNNDSYTHKYDELKGNFISAKTNNKDKYVAQVNFDIDTTNTYLILMDIYEFLKVNLNQDNPISVFNNVIVSNDNIDEVYIYDLLGSNVISEENYTGTVFHLNSLNPGLYLYRVKSGNKYYSNKFIIEK